MIFITGATGMLGSYFLFYLLEKNKSIRVLRQKTSTTKEVLNVFKELNPEKYQEYFDKIQWVEGSFFDDDFLDKSLNGIEDVYHCAAYISFNEDDKKKMFKINHEATKNLINSCIKNKINKFCYISSIATLGESDENNKIDETSNFSLKLKNTAYGLSKYAAEMEVFRASQEGLNVVIVNPGIILGSHHWKRKSTMLLKLCNRKRSFSSSGIHHLVDVRDVAKIGIQLMEQNIFNEKFILVSNPISIIEQNYIITKILNRPNSLFINDFLFKSFINCVSIFRSFVPAFRELNENTFYALTSKKIISNKKIIDKIGYDFIPTEESLKYHTNNYKNALQNESI